jgi:hypothetical protein
VSFKSSMNWITQPKLQPAVVLKQVTRKTMNEKNPRTALDNTADHIQEVCDDNGCDDAEEEDRHVAARMEDEVVIHACSG